MELTEEMLDRAMKAAVRVGVFPAHADYETYLHRWQQMEEILKAALNSHE